MKFNIQKSFEILIKNPYIMLLLVTYLLITASAFPVAVYTYKTASFYIITALLFFFTCAFLSGWFGMIRCIVSCKETKDPEEEMKIHYHYFKNDFFSSITNYILPVIFYILLLIGFIYGISRLADVFFGKPADILNRLALYKGDTDALYNFAVTVPKDALKVIIERNLFKYSALLLYFFLTFYSIPALFFNACKSPLSGLQKGFLALFKKPFFTLLLFLLIVLTHILLIFIEAVSVVNNILMFIALVLRVSFLAYVVVLIFSVYEENFTADCYNGPDCVGKNGACN